MKQERAQLFENYTAEEGPNSVLTNDRKVVVQELILQSVDLAPNEAERRQMVQDSTGISALSFSLVLTGLVNEGVLERGTLKFVYQEQQTEK